MTLETTGTDNIEMAMLAILKILSAGEQVLNERAPGVRPQNVPFTTFMVYWQEGNAFVYKMLNKTDTNLTQTVSDDSYFTARVICYGKDSLKRCNILRSSLNSDLQPVQVLKKQFGICDIDDIQAIPESNVDGMVRERAYFNFKFYARVSQTFDIDWFNSLNLVVSVPEVGFSQTDLAKEV